MATFLAHLRIDPADMAKFEMLATAMTQRTLEDEAGVVRYEYLRGREPGQYYTLGSFADPRAFLTHQVSEHHETIAKQMMSMVIDFDLEWLDGVPDATTLPTTTAIDDEIAADPSLAAAAARFPIDVQAWWRIAAGTDTG